MEINVCFVYPWATFGGVERVLLNRAIALRECLPEVHLDIFFLHDSGGLSAMNKALRHYGVNSNTSIVSGLDKKYDLVSIIDCPTAIRLCLKRSLRFIVECHTPYRQNREYLANLSDRCERVITPSKAFSNLIRREFPQLAIPIVELRNFVPWELAAPLKYDNVLPPWPRKPLLFFGRLDRLKDPLSLLDAFQLLERRCKDRFIPLFCGPMSSEVDIRKEIAKRSLDEIAVVFPPVPFFSSATLMASVARAGGIFVSPSKGESFGLSAAEAISSSIPVVLSDLKPHLELVRGYENIFTYPLGDTDGLSERIEGVFDHYNEAREATLKARNAYSAATFIEDWQHLLTELNI